MSYHKTGRASFVILDSAMLPAPHAEPCTQNRSKGKSRSLCYFLHREIEVLTEQAQCVVHGYLPLATIKSFSLY